MTHPASERNLTLLEPLDLKDLPEEGLHFDEALPQTWLTETFETPEGLRYATPDDGRAVLDVTPLGAVLQRPPVRLVGELSASVHTDCVRCLEQVRSDVRTRVDVTLFPDGEDPSDDAGLDGVYEGTRLPLPSAIREFLLLELDMNPVCADEAACDVRTKALMARVNAPGDAAMEAAQTEPDPRWAALRDLKLGDSDG